MRRFWINYTTTPVTHCASYVGGEVRGARGSGRVPGSDMLHVVARRVGDQDHTRHPSGVCPEAAQGLPRQVRSQAVGDLKHVNTLNIN